MMLSFSLSGGLSPGEWSAKRISDAKASYRRHVYKNGRMRTVWVWIFTFVLLGFTLSFAAVFRELELRREMRESRHVRLAGLRATRMAALLDEADAVFLSELFEAAHEPYDHRCGRCKAAKQFKPAAIGSEGFGDAVAIDADPEARKLIKKICRNKHRHCNWRFAGAAYFTFTLYTTIGFGNFAPLTAAGKGVVILCTGFGLVIAFALFHAIGDRLNSELRRWHLVRTHPGKAFAAMFVAYVLLGGACVHGAGLLQESASVWDGAYFCFVAISTLGLGDRLPRVSVWPLLTTYLYVIFGIALASAWVHTATEAVGGLDETRDAGAEIKMFRIRSPWSPCGTDLW
jgi:hypothetical protein